MVVGRIKKKAYTLGHHILVQRLVTGVFGMCVFASSVEPVNNVAPVVVRVAADRAVDGETESCSLHGRGARTRNRKDSTMQENDDAN